MTDHLFEKIDKSDWQNNPEFCPNQIRTTHRFFIYLFFFEPIQDGVKTIVSLCKFVMHNCQSLIVIGLTKVYFTVLTNKKLC